MLRVSVVIAARNEEARIVDCLRSVLAQDYPRRLYEVIVVDDGSSDRTAEVARSFGVCVLRQVASGGAAARNLGITSSQGEVVAFTDADCRPARDWLRLLVAPLAEEEDVGVCGGEVVGLVRSPVAEYVEAAGYFGLDRLARTKPWPVFMTANVAYRREVFRLLGTFDPDMGAADDLEMTWRVLRDGRFRAVACPRAVVYHLHPTTVSALYEQWRSYGAGRARVWAKLWGRPAAYREGLTQGARAAATLGLLPLRVLKRSLEPEGTRWARVAYPFLDAVRAAGFVAGYWAALRGRLPRGTWRERAGET